jgi:adenylate kinase
MSHQPHIVRQQETDLLCEMTKALEAPESSPALFHIWGIGGIGKSTLLNAREEHFKQRADCSKFSFGGVNETPLSIMEKLYQGLPEHEEEIRLGWSAKNGIKSDSFLQKYNTYKKTLNILETIPIDDQKTVEKEQIDQVKQLGKFLVNGGMLLAPVSGLAGSLPLGLTSALATKPTIDKGVDWVVDGAVSALSIKDSLLHQHPKTKKNPELQELMLSPWTKLTEAFVDDLERRARQRPVILILDTYEKSTPEIDIWLRQFLLTNKKMKKSKIRIIISGRYRLIKKEEWKELKSNHNLIIHEVESLKEFNPEQIEDYAKQIGIDNQKDITRLRKLTKGFPFHLDLIRQRKQEGDSINFSEEISERLLWGLTQKQRDIVELAACCRWFDSPLIEHLAITQGLNFLMDADSVLNCFDWLKQFNLVEYVNESTGWYRIKDIPRDAIRQSLFNHTALVITVRDSRILSLPYLPFRFCPRWISKTL